MLQIVQYQKDGNISLMEVPIPIITQGKVLVKTAYSVISSGTERTSVTTAQASMIKKAKLRPDLLKQVKDNISREGLLATYKKVKSRLDNYKSLGYSSSGIVVDSSVPEFKSGDRVACAGTAYHAEYVLVSQNLLVHIPNKVGLDEASFTTLGAIALQGIRQSEIRIGEKVAVIGLGILGLLSVQILKANGCSVVGLDISSTNFSLAKQLGCDECFIADFNSIRKVKNFTNGIGTDSVLITAGTQSNQPLELALEYARRKSNIVIVGAVSMNLSRSPFYEKELDLKISCSYGPGRYDPKYEEYGIDYPIDYVRWTENRNMQAVLDLMNNNRIDVKKMITHRYALEDSLKAYDLVSGKNKERYLGILIEYGNKQEKIESKIVLKQTKSFEKSLHIGFIGAGNFAQSYLLPNLQDKRVSLRGVATLSPIEVTAVARKFRFEFCSTNIEDIIKDDKIQLVVIATNHESHAKLTKMALQSGKHVYVEKPLAVSHIQLNDVIDAYKKYSNGELLVMCGYNRRFSYVLKDIKNFFKDSKEPYVITYRVNAGSLPSTNWIYDPEQGGRIIGEGCHFIDCMQFITNAKPVRVYGQAVKSKISKNFDEENVQININFDDGSIGSLIYIANGDKTLEKEYLEVSSCGKTAILNDFKEVFFYSNGKIKKEKYNGTKGHYEEMIHLIDILTIKERPSMTFESIVLTTLTTIKAMESIRNSQVLNIDERYRINT